MVNEMLKTKFFPLAFTAIVTLWGMIIFVQRSQFVHIGSYSQVGMRSPPIRSFIQSESNSTKSTTTDNEGAELHHRPPSGEKFILLLAYQRVGSSFLGKMFNLNDQVAYVYEPLDGVYTHLYGTSMGWAVPMDIHFHWNTTPRVIPKQEKETLVSVIDNIFNCDYDKVIPEQLISDFWTAFYKQSTFAEPYADCLKTIRASLRNCKKYIEKECPFRIGQNLIKEKHCNSELSKLYNETFTTTPSGSPAVVNYYNCVHDKSQVAIAKCVPLITQACSRKRIRAIKTVRLEAQTIESLMEVYPNMKIIHLIRDPRAVVLSRLKTSWATLGTSNHLRAMGLLKKQPTKRHLLNVDLLLNKTRNAISNAHNKSNTSDIQNADVVGNAVRISNIDNIGDNVLKESTMQNNNDNYTDAEELTQSQIYELVADGEDSEDIQLTVDYLFSNISQTTPHDFAKEARLYCYQVLKDMKTRQKLERTYPGRTYEMIYEHMINHPLHEVELVYKFIDEIIPSNVLLWAKAISTGSLDSKVISEKWMTVIPKHIVKDMDQFCQPLYDEIKYNWPDVG